MIFCLSLWFLCFIIFILQQQWNRGKREAQHKWEKRHDTVSTAGGEFSSFPSNAKKWARHFLGGNDLSFPWQKRYLFFFLNKAPSASDINCEFHKGICSEGRLGTKVLNISGINEHCFKSFFPILCQYQNYLNSLLSLYISTVSSLPKWY